MDTMDDRLVQGLDITNQPALYSFPEDTVAPQAPMPTVAPPPALQMAPNQPGVLSQVQNFIQNPDNGRLMLAMAGGMGSGRTPLQGLGGAFAAANEHLQYQDKLRMVEEQRKEALKLKQEQLAEQKRLNDGKISSLVAKAAKDGIPKPIAKVGAMVTLLYPDGHRETVTDEESQQLFNQLEQNKTVRAALIGGMKAENAPLPSPVIKDINESTDAIQNANNIVSTLDKTEGRLTDGSLDLSLFGNLYSQGKNLIGRSDEESRAFASLKSDLEGLRNNYLAIQKGTQTEGDAQRAWNQLISSLNDKEVVKQRIAELRELNKRAIAEHQQRINAARTDNGKDPLEFAPNGLPLPVSPKSAIQKNLDAVKEFMPSPAAPKQKYPEDVTNLNKRIADLKVTMLNPSASAADKKKASDELVRILNKGLEPDATAIPKTPLAATTDTKQFTSAKGIKYTIE